MNEVRRSRRWEIAAFVIVLSLVAVRAWFWFASSQSTAATPTIKRLAAGEIVETFGMSLSPNGKSRVDLQPTTGGNWSVKVSANNARGVPSGEMKFNHTGWFGAWDEQDRFWLCLPGYGVYHYTENETKSSSTRAGESGGWDGVPQPFVDRLTASERHLYEQGTTPHN